MTGQHHSLSDAIAHSLARAPDARARDTARLHLLDWIGCVAGARQSEACEVISAAEPDPLLRAAFLGNVLEMDDVHRTAILHPGPCIWPVVLAGAGLDSPADMATRLNAAVRGYEAMIAIGASFDAQHYAHYHNTATAGIFGAAAAHAAMHGADHDQMVSALGLAGSVSGGLWQMRHEATHAKQWHVLHAADSGSRAAHYALHGMVGPRWILEGPQGLYAASCASPKPLETGQGWRMDEVSFKPWGACRHAHPAIDAALELRAKDALAGEIHVETYADAIAFCDRPHPASVAEAKFSLQHAVAIVAERGEPRLQDFEPDAIAALADARARVTVTQSADITARYPDHFGARVTASGQVADHVDTRGDPERPMSRDGLIAKAQTLIRWGGLSDAEVDRATRLALESDDAGAITAMVQEWLA